MAQMIKTGMNNKQMKAIAKKAMMRGNAKEPMPMGGEQSASYKKTRKTQSEREASDQRYQDENSNVGLKRKAMKKAKKGGSGQIKHTGTFQGKSNQLGQGGRAAQMRARGVPGGVIGAIARREGAAPGQRNFHKRA